MNRALQLVVLLMALLALSLHGVADAACKVKGDDTTAAKDADIAPAGNGTNKIQDAPSKRMTNKIAFDVVDEEAVKRKRMTNKIAFDVADKSADHDDEGGSDN